MGNSQVYFLVESYKLMHQKIGEQHYTGGNYTRGHGGNPEDLHLDMHQDYRAEEGEYRYRDIDTNLGDYLLSFIPESNYLVKNIVGGRP